MLTDSVDVFVLVTCVESELETVRESPLVKVWVSVDEKVDDGDVVELLLGKTDSLKEVEFVGVKRVKVCRVTVVTDIEISSEKVSLCVALRANWVMLFE